MHVRFPQWLMAVVTAMAVLLGLAAAANADDLQADGDLLIAGIQNSANLGNVCAGASVSQNVTLTLLRLNGPQNQTNQVFENGTNVTISATVNANAPLAAAFGDQLIATPPTWSTTQLGSTYTGDTAVATITRTNAATGNFSNSVTFSATGRRLGGNANQTVTRTTTFTVTGTVVNCDTTPPVLSLPGTTTVEATGPTGAVVNYTVSATDGAPANPTVTCAPASGSTFAIGTTPVSCSSTDAAGNTATGSFNVVVQDTTIPVINGTPANFTVEAAGPTGAVVTYTNPTATDIVDGTRPVTCVPASGSQFALGDTTISCTASDTRNNTATASFTATVSDTTKPSLFLPADITAEATSPAGAAVPYSVSASDSVDTNVVPSCSPASGTTFAIATTPVNCTATDDSDNTATGSFDVTVDDTTPPAFGALPAPTEEAAGPAGAVVSYGPVTATDIVDGTVSASCLPPSGNTFALGSTTVTCSATDARNNTATATFHVVVADTTAPELTLPADKVVEATGPNGAAVTFPAATAEDAVDLSVDVSCDAASGDIFPLGTTQVLCTATDDSGNVNQGQFAIQVRDTTGPSVTVTPAGNQTLEATGPTGAAATYSASATDLVDGTVPVTCTPTSGSTFAIATTGVTCTATDAAGNPGSATFDVTVQDTTPPNLTVPADITVDPTGPAGAAVTYAVSATDLVDGSLTPGCSQASGSTFAIGTTTVGCTVTDVHGNTASKTFKVTVKPLTLKGFYQPVDMSTSSTVYNTVKAGSTVPFKFEVFAGTTELTATSVVSSFTTTTVACSSGAEDAIEEITSTGGTSLRYDTTGGQYIQNWQTPKSAGACFKVTMTTPGNTSLVAYFKLK